MPNLVIFCGLGGLHDELTNGIKEKLPQSVHLKKNTLTDGLFDGKNHTTSEYKAAIKNVYKALNAMALDQLKDGNNVVLQGYYGNRLTHEDTIKYITPENGEYNVKIIYLHCSGDKHREILTARGSDRDSDKQGDKYNPYRLAHIGDHLRELAKVSGVLLIDIENDSFDQNLAKILKYINTPSSIKITGLDSAATLRLANLSVAEALGGMEVFKKLLSEVRGIDPSLLDAEQAALIKTNQTYAKMFTQAFSMMQGNVSASTQLANDTTHKTSVPKFVILAGGLAGSGKTTHLMPLITSLRDERGLSVAYLDKDEIARTLPADAKVYNEMIKIADKNSVDVVIHEGNMIGNLNLFKDYIQAQHKTGAKVICLDFQCSDPKIQHDRIVKRAENDANAKARDINKLDYEYYTSTDRPSEELRHDKQIAAHQDLIDGGVINLIKIDTTESNIEENVASIIDYMDKLTPVLNQSSSKITCYKL